MPGGARQQRLDVIPTATRERLTRGGGPRRARGFSLAPHTDDSAKWVTTLFMLARNASRAAEGALELGGFDARMPHTDGVNMQEFKDFKARAPRSNLLECLLELIG